MELQKQIKVFKEWYDAQWLGDQEHGQYIPLNGDKKYTEYLDGYTLGLGAWIACYLTNKRLEKAAGYCTEGDRCVCCGDTPAVRAGCANWMTPNAKGQRGAACGASAAPTGCASNGNYNERTDK